MLGNFLIALSGFVLYSDKAMSFLAIEFAIPEKWAAANMDFETFVWFLSQTFSPILWALGTFIYRKTFMHFVPLYCYMLQLHFIFRDYLIIDNTYFNYYVVGTTILATLSFHGVKWLLKRRAKIQIKNIRRKILKDG
jgi:hypothetical protein